MLAKICLVRAATSQINMPHHKKIPKNEMGDWNSENVKYGDRKINFYKMKELF